MAATTLQPPTTQYMTSIDRAVREENFYALIRRWQYAKAGVMDDAKFMQRWFPGQRELLSTLSVLSDSEALHISDCGIPLFSIRLPHLGTNDSVYTRPETPTPMENEAAEEVFMALMARSDALRVASISAVTLYDMPKSAVSYLNTNNARKLRCVSYDQSVMLVPSVADEYFVLAATSQMPAPAQTVLASTTRRQRSL